LSIYLTKEVNISELIMINQELVNKINSLLDKGITFGFNPDPKPGNMCVEQVISYALGEGFSDKPSCVGEEVRDFVTCLNDRNWSSASARAEGMKELSIAQLGSNSLDQDEFREKIIFAMVTKMLPSMFKDLGEDKWKKEIKSLEGAKDLEGAIKATDDAAKAAAADVAAGAAYAVRVAASDRVHAVRAVNYAAANAAYATKTGDKYLKMACHLAVSVLKEMGNSGCSFLTMKA